jgi:hypothetical protein
MEKWRIESGGERGLKKKKDSRPQKKELDWKMVDR